MRRRLGNTLLDPRIGQVAIDAKALDCDGCERDRLVGRFRSLEQADKISVLIVNSVLTEVSHPHTPGAVKTDFQQHIYTLPTSRTPAESKRLSQIQGVLQGNAAFGKHLMDAQHLFEAEKYGCRYFVTHDKRILRKREEIERILGPAFRVVTLEAFLSAYDKFDSPAPP